MYCQSRLCLEGKQLRGRQAQNCNVILAAIFFLFFFFALGRNKEKVGGGWATRKNISVDLSGSDVAAVNTVENNDFELRFSGTESGTSLITRGQMSSLLAVSLVAGGAASFPSLAPGPSLCFPLSPLPFFCKFLHVL